MPVRQVGILGIRIADLEFMPALHCHPWIVAGIRKAHEDAGVGNRLFLHELAAQARSS